MMRSPVHARAFTLAELLAVMGIIAVLGVVITTSAQRVSKQAKVSSATNQVLAALGQARGIAIRDRATILVAFRVWQATYRPTPTSPEVIDASKPQQTEIVIAKATGRVGFPGTAVAGATVEPGSYTVLPEPVSANPFDADRLLEEFRLVEGLPPKLLPVGIKVAGSAADWPGIGMVGQDELWIAQPALKNLERGNVVVVRFAPDGSMQTRNPALSGNLTGGGVGDNAAVAPWIDFDRDGLFDIGTTVTPTSDTQFYAYDERRDESLGQHTMFLAVFNDDQFHEEASATSLAEWQGSSSTLNSSRGFFISQNCDRIQFNRFTGVAEVLTK